MPGVEKTTPRGEFTLKKFAGKLLGADRASGTPSQLISRRTPPKEPFAPATVPPPRSTRKASRAAVILAGVVPLADSRTCARAPTGMRKASARAAMNVETELVFIGGLKF